MATVDRRVFAYNFTTSLNISKLMHDYNKILNNDKSKLKERGLIYRGSNDKFLYFLDTEEIKVTTSNKEDSSKLTVMYKCTLFKMRDTDLPLVLNIATGNKTGLALSNKDTLAEPTHFVIFPELNLILSEYNNSGARIEKLRSVLDEVLKLNSTDMEILPLLRKDNYKNIISSRSIKELDFKVGHLGLKTLKDNSILNIFDSLNLTFEDLSSFNVEIKITGKRSKIVNPMDKETLVSSLIKLSNKILGKKADNSFEKDDIKRIKTKIYDGQTIIPIDLLEEKLVHTLKVVKLDNRFKYLDSNDMFNKIIDLYKNNTLSIDRYISIE